MFDLFGVIIGFDNDIVYRRLAAHCTDSARAFRELNGLMAAPDVITGKATLPEIHRSLVERHGLRLEYPAFETAWLEPYSWPMPHMAELLMTLAEHYRLVMLSNIDGYYWRAIRPRHPELDGFRALLVSCDLGVAKPDAAAFRHAARAAGAEPNRILFIDDTVRNVRAAESLGFQAHHFAGVPELHSDLRDRGLRAL